MYYGRRTLVLTGLAAAALGAGLHFLYGWFPNGLTALVSPVRESLWEQLKLIFWPYLAAALWLSRGRPRGMRPWLLVLPLLCGLALLAGWGYHILWDGGALWADILIYALVMALGFWLPGQFSGPFDGLRWLLPVLAAVLIGMLIGLFTLWPPESVLFADLSGVPTWVRMPC